MTGLYTIFSDPNCGTCEKAPHPWFVAMVISNASSPVLCLKLISKLHSLLELQPCGILKHLARFSHVTSGN